MNVLLASMLIGELTLIGLLGLKKAVYSVPALAPLVAITVLYMAMVCPKRLQVASNLPAQACAELDRRDADESLEFLRGAYVQPALKDRKLYPEVH